MQIRNRSFIQLPLGVVLLLGAQSICRAEDLLDGGTIGKAFKGELSDISVGGMSFFITTASQKNALMLLGRKLNVKFKFAIGGSYIDIDQNGVIIGVINHLFSDYSVHLRFDKMLNGVVVEKLGMISHTEKESKLDDKPDKSVH